MVKIGNIELGSFPLLLAPMEDVSDPPFRALCKENGLPIIVLNLSDSGAVAGAIRGEKVGTLVS